MGAGSETLCQTELEQPPRKEGKHHSPRSVEASDSGCEVPTTLAPQTPTCFPCAPSPRERKHRRTASEVVNNPLYDNCEEASRKAPPSCKDINTSVPDEMRLFELRMFGTKGKKATAKAIYAIRLPPAKLLVYVTAMLLFGVAWEFALQEAETHTTCRDLKMDKERLTTELQDISDDMATRVDTLSLLLTKIADENKRLVEELDMTKKKLKYFQGNKKVPEELFSLKHEDEESWVDQAVQDGVHKIWQFRYLVGQGINTVRTAVKDFVPKQSRINEKLKWLEDTVVGPTE